MRGRVKREAQKDQRETETKIQEREKESETEVKVGKTKISQIIATCAFRIFSGKFNKQQNNK